MRKDLAPYLDGGNNEASNFLGRFRLLRGGATKERTGDASQIFPPKKGPSAAACLLLNNKSGTDAAAMNWWQILLIVLGGLLAVLLLLAFAYAVSRIRRTRPMPRWDEPPTNPFPEFDRKRLHSKRGLPAGRA